MRRVWREGRGDRAGGVERWAGALEKECGQRDTALRKRRRAGRGERCGRVGGGRVSEAEGGERKGGVDVEIETGGAEGAKSAGGEEELGAEERERERDG